MGSVFRLVVPDHAVEIFGVKLVGVNDENGLTLWFTLGFICLLLLLGRGIESLARKLLAKRNDERAQFWTQQAIRLGTALLFDARVGVDLVRRSGAPRDRLRARERPG